MRKAAEEDCKQPDNRNSERSVNPARFDCMSDDAKHFRNRASDCRALSKGARNQVDKGMLEDSADQLDEEARKIDAEHCKTERD